MYSSFITNNFYPASSMQMQGMVQPSYYTALTPGNTYNMNSSNQLFNMVNDLYGMMGRYQTQSYSLANNPYYNTSSYASYPMTNMTGGYYPSSMTNMTGSYYPSSMMGYNSTGYMDQYGYMSGLAGYSSPYSASLGTTTSGLNALNFLGLYNTMSGTSTTGSTSNMIAQMIAMAGLTTTSTSNTTSSFEDLISQYLNTTTNDPIYSINTNNNDYISTTEFENYILENIDGAEDLSSSELADLITNLKADINETADDDNSKVTVEEFEEYLDMDGNGKITQDDIDEFNENIPSFLDEAA